MSTSSSSSSGPTAELILKSLEVPTEGLTPEQMNQIVNSLKENAAMLNLLMSSSSTAPFEESLVTSLGIHPDAAQEAVKSLVGSLSLYFPFSLAFIQRMIFPSYPDSE